jgi:CubicO group peptidase (beta-lactamase class C family)
VTGKCLAALAQDEIIKPLNLERTFFNPLIALQTEIAACETGNVYERETCREAGVADSAWWRRKLIWGEVHDGNAHFLGGAAGHAGLFSTAPETSRIAEQFVAGQSELLKPQTCDLFRINMTEGLEEARSIAWQLALTKESTAGPALPPESFGHTGFTGTSCWVDPHHKRIFVLLTNRTHAHSLPFVNINSIRRQFHFLAVTALNDAEPPQ